MPESYVQDLFADRIGGKNYGKGSVVYKFEKIRRAREAAVLARPDVPLIDMGVGEPDGMAYPGVVNALSEQAAMPENRGYSDNGIPEFKEAVAQYMARVYGVENLDPINEITHAVGAKNALAFLPTCFINPGDAIIMTTPGYPVLGTHARWYGGEAYTLPLHEANHYLPDLQSLTDEQLAHAKILLLNYPNNPTGAVATREFFAEVVEFARQHRLLVVQDAAYAALVFEGSPLSFLSMPGAKDVGVEIHSMSKAFNMTGWRLAWVCGNELAVRAFADVKDNFDSGQFKAIQKASIYALRHPEITVEIAEKYNRRLTLLAQTLNSVGFRAHKPAASFFLYVRTPQGIVGGQRFASGEDFSQYLIREKLICTVPWDDVGPYIRLSVTFEAASVEEEKHVIEEIGRRLSDVQFEF
ncbi:MAG: LL-diaminopimelate aminotransferase [Candidatus Tectomicrobia bacterium]|uniref:Aminotransferase n=1 Tax=Tectimicrobiota bacterium TaxID=2528274 RepID=A0A937W6A4_UNCTE|nr:LL-diaminopimelate aminotransferase [Candidatus Tectomicrobia bacterium]